MKAEEDKNEEVNEVVRGFALASSFPASCSFAPFGCFGDKIFTATIITAAARSTHISDDSIPQLLPPRVPSFVAVIVAKPKNATTAAAAAAARAGNTRADDDDDDAKTLEFLEKEEKEGEAARLRRKRRRCLSNQPARPPRRRVGGRLGRRREKSGEKWRSGDCRVGWLMLLEELLEGVVVVVVVVLVGVAAVGAVSPPTTPPLWPPRGETTAGEAGRAVAEGEEEASWACAAIMRSCQVGGEDTAVVLEEPADDEGDSGTLGECETGLLRCWGLRWGNCFFCCFCCCSSSRSS